MGTTSTDHSNRKRLRRRLEARGVPADEVAAAVGALRRRQAAARSADEHAYARWRHRHPGLPPSTIRLVVAELRRHHAGTR